MSSEKGDVEPIEDALEKTPHTDEITLCASCVDSLSFARFARRPYGHERIKFDQANQCTRCPEHRRCCHGCIRGECGNVANLFSPGEDGAHLETVHVKNCRRCQGCIGIGCGGASITYEYGAYNHCTSEHGTHGYATYGPRRSSIFFLPIQRNSLQSTAGFNKASSTYDPRCLNTSLIRQWLRTCDEHHGRQCRNTAIPAPSHRILLVDTTRHCLVDGTKDAKYAALSYVWGTGRNFRTTKATLPALRQIGSLRRQSHIPNTIQDAIRLAYLLQIPFVWIDSLCIIQDDEEFRSIHLTSMAAIYANAYVTFIAAQGDHADFGIPGIEHGNKARHIPYRTLKAEDGTPYYLRQSQGPWRETSKWNTRGWTYQEGLLSSRAIILKDCTSWYCTTGWWQEDLDINTSPEQLWDRRDWFPSPTSYFIDDSGSQKMPNRLDFWSSFVVDYNRRDLGSDDDALAAFAGVSKVMQKCFRRDISFGMPEEFFHKALLWDFYGWNGLPRRRRSVVPGTCINSLPSWSWVGWHGKLDLSLWNQQGSFTVRSSSEAVVRMLGEACCGKACPHLEVETAAVAIAKCGSFEFTVRKRSGLLLLANRQTEISLKPHQDAASAETLLRNSPNQWLIAISSAMYTRSFLTWCGLAFEHARESSSEYPIMAVLWVEWEGDTAFRKGLGWVKRDDWERCCPRTCKIKLG